MKSEGVSIFEVPELRNTLQVRGNADLGAKLLGKGTTILLEGHDISHMVTRLDYASDVNDATRVTIQLVGLRMI
jgi:hypothetical protein